MQKSHLYAAGGLLAAALLAAGLVLLSHYHKPAKAVAAEAQGLAKPRGLALAPDGGLYIVDSRNHRIEKRGANGAMQRRFGKNGIRDGELREPCGVALGKDGFLYVADTFYTLDPKGGLPWGRIQKFSADGVFAGSWGKVPVLPNDLFGPRDIAVDSKNFVYVSDTGDHRIVKYSSDGSFVKTWGKKGSAAGEFIEPFGIAFDDKDRLYVVDRLNFRVQIFDSNGKYLREFKADTGDQEQINREPYVAVDSVRGWVWVSNPAAGHVSRYSLDGSGHKAYDTALEGKLKQPTGMAVRPDGTLLVSDGEQGKIMTVKP
ncbi:MAG: NHL repeat-containing protein [candidate division FCPU426 bacterium]